MATEVTTWKCDICGKRGFPTREQAVEHEERLGRPTTLFDVGTRAVFDHRKLLVAPNGVALTLRAVRYDLDTQFGDGHIVEYELYDPLTDTSLGWHSEREIRWAMLQKS